VKIGIVSDTHDHLSLIGKAVEAFNASGVGLVLHAGDFVSPFTAPRFKPLKARMTGVFGNNDGDRTLLRRRFSEINVEIKDTIAVLEAEAVRMAATHGHDEDLLKALIDSGSFGVVAYGHTHQAVVERRGKTLVINPGEACGYLSGDATIAILDTARLEAEIIRL